jgi:hypothetical protein
MWPCRAAGVALRTQHAATRALVSRRDSPNVGPGAFLLQLPRHPTAPTVISMTTSRLPNSGGCPGSKWPILHGSLARTTTGVWYVGASKIISSADLSVSRPHLRSQRQWRGVNPVLEFGYCSTGSGDTAADASGKPDRRTAFCEGREEYLLDLSLPTARTAASGRHMTFGSRFRSSPARLTSRTTT